MCRPLFGGAEEICKRVISATTSSAQALWSDGGQASYILGMNEKSALQSIYWGNRLSASDTFPAPHSEPREHPSPCRARSVLVQTSIHELRRSLPERNRWLRSRSRYAGPCNRARCTVGFSSA